MANEISHINYSIVIPVYNGETLLNLLIENILMLKKSNNEIIFVDDCSSDNTNNILRKYEEIILITHDKNYGFGKSVISGIEMSKGKKIIIFSIDSLITDKDIPFLLSKAHQYDLVIGARLYKKDIIGTFNEPYYYRLLNSIKSLTLYFTKNIKIIDPFSDIFVVDYKIFNEFEFKTLGYTFTYELINNHIKNGYTVVEVPIQIGITRGQTIE